MLDDLGKEHYDEKQVFKLAELLPEGVSLDDLKRKLDIEANQYLISRTSYEDAPTHAESKEALKYLQEHAQALLNGLQMLDGKSWNLVLAPEEEASYRLLEEGTVMTSLGYEIVGERWQAPSTLDTFQRTNYATARCLK